MNTIGVSFILVMMLHASAAAAMETKEGKQAQPSRMSVCSAEAKEKGMKGEARKEYMSQCLRNSESQTAAKACGATAKEKGLKGAQRKEFIAECVKTKDAGSVG